MFGSAGPELCVCAGGAPGSQAAKKRSGKSADVRSDDICIDSTYIRVTGST